MKYQSLHTILKYRFNIPNLIFHVQNIGISYRNGMLKRYLRIVCKDRYFILFRYEILIQFQMGNNPFSQNLLCVSKLSKKSKSASYSQVQDRSKKRVNFS